MDADPVARVLRSSEALLFLANNLPEDEGGLALILFQLGKSLKQSGEDLDDKEGAPVCPVRSGALSTALAE